MIQVTSVLPSVREPTRVRIVHDRDEWTVALGGTLSGSRARVHRIEQAGPYVYTVGSSEWANRAQVHELHVLKWGDVEREDVKREDVEKSVDARKEDGWTMVFEWPTQAETVHLVFQRELSEQAG